MKKKILQLLEGAIYDFENISGRKYDDCNGYSQARTHEEAYLIGKIKVCERLLQ